jgi:hypothetical protein
MKLFLTMAVAAMLGTALTGCIVHAHGHPYHRGVAIVVPAGHVHDAHCGHYHYRGAWYHWEGHVHGPGCGHIHRGGIWIIAD